jgi:hypothetical protein
VRIPDFWQFDAHGDGHCFFYSALLLLRHAGVIEDEAYDENGYRMLRGKTVYWWKNLYRDRDTEDWWAKYLDDQVYPDAAARNAYLDRMENGSEYADLAEIAALADYYDVEFVVHPEGGEPVHLVGDFCDDPHPVLHVAFRGGEQDQGRGHYWPLLPGDGTSLPPDLRGAGIGALRRPGLTDAAVRAEDAPQVALDPTPYEGGGASVRTVDLGYRERRFEERRSTRANAPKLITQERKGYSYGAAINASVDTWLKLGIEAGYVRIVKNVNPDNDGHYLNVKLRAGLLARGLSQSFNDDSVDLPEGSSEAGTKESWDKFASPLLGQAQIEAWLKEWFDAEWGGSQEAPINSFGLDYNRASRYLEFNFVGVGDHPSVNYRLQYMRWVYSSSKSAAVEIPVYVGVGVNVGLAGSKTAAISEKIGTNTLTYLETIFNGLKQRPDGKAQWKAYLEQQEAKLCDLFRRIAKHEDSRVHRDVLEHQDYASRTADWEHETPLHGHRDDWLALFPGSTRDRDLIAACRSSAKNLYFTRTDQMYDWSAAGKRDTLQPLCGALTDLFWKSTQVKAKLNALEHPWRTETIHLAPAQGEIEFILKLHPEARCFYVVEPPHLVNHYTRSVRSNKRLFDYDPHDTYDEKAKVLRHAEYYRVSPDVLKNPALAEATTALPYYEHGFEVVLRLHLGRKKPLKIRGRQPDPMPEFQRVVLELASEAANKRWSKDRNLPAFKALLNLHFELGEAFKDWVAALEADKKAKSHEDWVQEANDCWRDFVTVDDGDNGTPRLATNRFAEVLLLIEGPFAAVQDYWDWLHRND